MPDWLMKIFSSIVSIKTALIALLTCINLVIFWSYGHNLIKNNEVDEGVISFIFIVICYSASHAVIIGLFKLSEQLKKLYINYQVTQKKSHNLKIFNKTIVTIIPHLPKAQIEILNELSMSEMRLDISGDTLNLEKQSYIKRIHEVSRSAAIFKINENVKKELSEYLSEERKKYLKHFIKSITMEETKFLSLFFSDDVTEGTCESGQYMEHLVLQSGRNMAHKKIILLTSSDAPNKVYYEIFRLEPEVAEILEKMVFHKNKVRNELTIDLNFVYASNSSGSGATQSNYKIT